MSEKVCPFMEMRFRIVDTSVNECKSETTTDSMQPCYLEQCPAYRKGKKKFCRKIK